MLQITQIKLPYESVNKDELKALKQKITKQLRIASDDLSNVTILKKSIDARKKPQIFYVYSICCTLKNPKQESVILKKNKDATISIYEPTPYRFPQTGTKSLSHRPIIIGMGPAGLFCGYMLAKAGYQPILYERGKKVEERTEDVLDFWKTGTFLPNSNVQFGEGGAGTFSDGKLNTLNKDKTGRNQEVLRIFVENGAPEHILYDSKPHIGTDILTKTVIGMRNKMLEYGAEIHYESQVTDFIIKNNTLCELEINGKERIDADVVVLAIGHSARDTFEILYENRIPMESKDFAVGMRVQHPQDYIDYTQYGMKNHDGMLPTASYKLTAQTSQNRGVYSFCMCPGGYVVNASGEKECLAVNGMSYSGRDSGVANSAIIVSVGKKDYGSEHPLAGVAFQRKLEKKAYELGEGKVVLQYYHDFCQKSGKLEYINKPFTPCVKGEYVFGDLKSLFSSEINNAFIEGMSQFGRVMPGFDDDFCILAGVESRTSSPVRIMRNKECESDINGLYPCGEGAGYAGGITSAAMDGLAVAEAIAKKFSI